jgi:hypothetical protein
MAPCSGAAAGTPCGTAWRTCCRTWARLGAGPPPRPCCWTWSTGRRRMRRATAPRCCATCSSCGGGWRATQARRRRPGTWNAGCACAATTWSCARSGWTQGPLLYLGGRVAGLRAVQAPPNPPPLLTLPPTHAPPPPPAHAHTYPTHTHTHICKPMRPCTHAPVPRARATAPVPCRATLQLALNAPRTSLVAQHAATLAGPCWPPRLLSREDDWPQCLATLKGHEQQALCVAFSPDGATAFSGGVDSSIRCGGPTRAWSYPAAAHASWAHYPCTANTRPCWCRLTLRLD